MGFHFSIIKKLSQKVILVLALGMLSVLSANAQDAKAGESIFKANCTACHAYDRQVIGPALKGVESRWASRDLLKKFILNSQSVIKSGDKYAAELYAKYNNTVMTNQNLTDAELENVLAYLKEGPAKPADAPAAGAAAAATDGSAINNYTIGGLILLLAVLIIVIIVLNRVIASLERLIRVKNGEVFETIVAAVKEKVSTFKWMLLNKKKVFWGISLFLVVFSAWGWNQMWNIGVAQGYQPTQPIKFSHELHAGINQVNCQYCHSGAFKSKNASIPSANVCMNCHNYVQATEKYNGEISPEIKKIYTALDYNPDTRTYGNNPKPIEWVRIHNLPDFAYFNHSQHTTVAGVECQTCHGPIEKMTEVYQYSPLTMGWCIDCHRKTEVNSKGNAYYDKVLAAHDEIKEGKKVTAAALGGLECVKCHY
jgi:cytochrome c551/c552